MDYKIKLMQILDCVASMEGTTFSDYWGDHGVMEDEQEQIEKDFGEFIKNNKIIK